MAYLELKTILAVIAVGTCSCAASPSAPPPRYAAAPESTGQESTRLSGAIVPSPVVPTAPPEVTPDAKARWTDDQIVGAVAAAETARDVDAKIARTNARSARVERFAQDLRAQARELEHAQASLPQPVSPVPSELRTRVEEARRATAEALRDPESASFDRHFIASEIAYERALLRLLDEEMIPSATSRSLKEFLQTFRAKTATSLIAAEQVEWNLH